MLLKQTFRIFGIFLYGLMIHRGKKLLNRFAGMKQHRPTTKKKKPLVMYLFFEHSLLILSAK